MFQVRIHGRGGQGVVTAAEIMSIASFYQGTYAQAFPSFGSERTGAPVVAYGRIDQQRIRAHEPVTHPHAVIVQDASLLGRVSVFDGLAADGYVVVNSAHDAAELPLPDAVRQLGSHLLVLPASDLAIEKLGRPLPNVALVAGLSALTGLWSLDSVLKAVRSRFIGDAVTGNLEVASTAYEAVRRTMEETTDA